MTRRRVVFIPRGGIAEGKGCWVTPEFNGDKTELKAFGSADSCDMDWKEIERKFFKPVTTLESFLQNHELVQRQYHSSIPQAYLGDSILPSTRVDSVEDIPAADEIIYITEGFGITTRERVS